jgi:hypothetical protein
MKFRTLLRYKMLHAIVLSLCRLLVLARFPEYAFRFHVNGNRPCLPTRTTFPTFSTISLLLSAELGAHTPHLFGPQRCPGPSIELAYLRPISRAINDFGVHELPISRRQAVTPTFRPLTRVYRVMPRCSVVEVNCTTYFLPCQVP